MATIARSAARAQASARRKTAGMRLVRGGAFLMGSDRHYPEEAPVRLAQVGDFWIDEHPVTNRQFAAFVAATGYTTFAEIAPDPAHYPGLPPKMARAGSAVFVKPQARTSVADPSLWWKFVFGADWRHPAGPQSSIDDRLDHPVVQVAYMDAEAYAAWAGKALPTEAEWEYAARGGLEGQDYAWGDELAPGGRMMANYWQGEFPWRNTLEDGFEGASPVGSFPPNGYGLYDMIGNVWEWTSDGFSVGAPSSTCCGSAKTESPGAIDVQATAPEAGVKVLKGGSHLCAENYCRRYRPAARHAQPIDSPTSHVGFRCIIRR